MEIFNVMAREEDPARCVLGNILNRVISYNINIYFSSTTLVISGPGKRPFDCPL